MSYIQKFIKKWGFFFISKPSCPLKACCHLKLNVSNWWPLFLKGYVGGWYVISFRFLQSTNLHYNLYGKHPNFVHENFLSLNCPYFHAFLWKKKPKMILDSLFILQEEKFKHIKRHGRTNNQPNLGQHVGNVLHSWALAIV